MQYLPLTLIITLLSSLFVALVLTPPFTATLMVVDSEIKDKKKYYIKRLRTNLIIAGSLLAIALIGQIGGTMWVRNLFGISALLVLNYHFLLKPASDWTQNKVLPAMELIYDRFIAFALKGIMPILFFGGTFILLFVSLILLQVFPSKVLFFPSAEPQYVNVFVDLPMGSRIQETDKFMRKIETKIDKVTEKYKTKGVVDAVLLQIGENVQYKIDNLINQMGLREVISLSGHPAWLFWNWNLPAEIVDVARSMFLQNNLAKGVLMLNTINLSLAFNSKAGKVFFDGLTQTLELVADSHRKNDYSLHLRGEVVKPLFKIR